jgi:hypothetical protein
MVATEECLVAGRDLDALIATQVMDIRIIVDAPGRSTDGGSFMTADRIPYYSTNLPAAWRVVEHMPHGFELRLHEHKLGIQPVWQAEFHRPGHKIQMSSAQTAPLAICLAALAALRIDQQ